MAIATSAQKRLFLQACLNTRFFSDREAQDLYKRTCVHYQVPYDPEQLGPFMSEVNAALDVYDMELRHGHSPDSGIEHHALVNTNGDEVAQLATGCSTTEINYFKHLLEIIVNADDDVFEISSLVALSEASRVKPPLTKRDAEALIARLIQAKWLVDRNGLISMSLRTVLELQTYLKDGYPDRIHECTLCLEIVTSDYERCNVANCQTRLHVHCSTTYFAKQTRKVCPSCQSPWLGILLGTGRRVEQRFRRRATQADESGASSSREEEEEEEEV